MYDFQHILQLKQYPCTKCYTQKKKRRHREGNEGEDEEEEEYSLI